MQSVAAQTIDSLWTAPRQPHAQPACSTVMFDNGTHLLTRMVAVNGSRGSDGWMLMAQLCCARRTALTVEFPVSRAIVKGTSAHAGTPLPQRGFVIAWTDAGADSKSHAVRARAFDHSGTARGSEIAVRAAPLQQPSAPAAAAFGDASFALAWLAGTCLSDTYIAAQRFDARGEPSGDELRVNSTPLRLPSTLALTALPSAGFVVTWHSPRAQHEPAGRDGVMTQMFDVEDARVGKEYLCVF